VGDGKLKDIERGVGVGGREGSEFDLGDLVFRK